jgi:uncharacterized membrane protein YphA (DoxX/SURF4 family)
MLNTFPDLLNYSFFAPTLLRIMVALVFIAGAYAQYKRREELSKLHFPIVGSGRWIIWLSILAHAAIGFMLFFGYYTQIAALLGAAGGIKGIVYAKHYPRLFAFCRLEYAFIVVICLSLLFTGAGAFAADLPL